MMTAMFFTTQSSFIVQSLPHSSGHSFQDYTSAMNTHHIRADGGFIVRNPGAAASEGYYVPDWLEDFCLCLRSNDEALTSFSNPCLRHSKFSWKGMSSQSFRYFCDSLGCNYTMKSLTLQDFGSVFLNLNSRLLVDVSELGTILRTNGPLEELVLSRTPIEGIEAVANALCDDNTTLKVLDLSTTHIGNRGAYALANMIKCNKTLLKLNLNENLIEQEGIVALVEALEHHNVTLRTLELEHNPGSSVKLMHQAKQWSLANQYGRYLLQEQDIPDALWPHVLRAKMTRDDQASCIYFFLQWKPELVRRRQQSQDADGGDDNTDIDVCTL